MKDGDAMGSVIEEESEDKETDAADFLVKENTLKFK
jgi:hypothetical protein